MNRTQHVASLTWSGCRPEADDQTIDQLEHQVGVRFPPDFRQVMKLCHGGTPEERCEFDYQHPQLGTVGSGIGAMLRLPLEEEDLESIVGTIAMLDDQLPDGLIPFATDGGGDFMCLDYRHDSNQPPVVYWAHEEDKDASVFPLADSFSEFLDMLIPQRSIEDYQRANEYKG